MTHNTQQLSGPLPVPLPNNISYLNCEIDDLIKAKELQITNLNFEEAEDIETAIQYKRECDAHVNLDRVCQKLENKIMAFYDRKENNVEVISTQFLEEENFIREATDSSLRALQKQHILELTNLEKSYSTAVLQANKRTIPKYEEMIEQAKGLARGNDFTAAAYMRKNAEKLQASVLKTRRQAIDKRYEDMKAQVSERQKNELLLLQRKLIESLNLNKKARKEALSVEEEKFRISVLHKQNKAIKKSTKTVKNQKLKLEMSDSVMYFVAQALQGITGKEHHASPRGMGNRSPYGSRSPSPKSSRNATPKSGSRPGTPSKETPASPIASTI